MRHTDNAQTRLLRNVNTRASIHGVRPDLIFSGRMAKMAKVHRFYLCNEFAPHASGRGTAEP
ncbi:MAG TPA: hypothetical protein VE131_06980 [Terriglobales bacterium]|nr:hypothetical protein [Terriglobales bacterium]